MRPWRGLMMPHSSAHDENYRNEDQHGHAEQPEAIDEGHCARLAHHLSVCNSQRFLPCDIVRLSLRHKRPNGLPDQLLIVRVVSRDVLGKPRLMKLLSPGRSLPRLLRLWLPERSTHQPPYQCHRGNDK